MNGALSGCRKGESASNGPQLEQGVVGFVDEGSSKSTHNDVCFQIFDTVN